MAKATGMRQRATNRAVALAVDFRRWNFTIEQIADALARFAKSELARERRRLEAGAPPRARRRGR